MSEPRIVFPAEAVTDEDKLVFIERCLLAAVADLAAQAPADAAAWRQEVFYPTQRAIGGERAVILQRLKTRAQGQAAVNLDVALPEVPRVLADREG